MTTGRINQVAFLTDIGPRGADALATPNVVRMMFVTEVVGR